MKTSSNTADRKLDKTQITTQATCNYIQEKHNIIILVQLVPGSPIWAVPLG